ncbi:hypothetical protein WCLP8_4940019 [uncultured Gammaproteobacteria bacterium]
MSKRPELGLDAVVRPSRLAAKGGAVPAAGSAAEVLAEALSPSARTKIHPTQILAPTEDETQAAAEGGVSSSVLVSLVNDRLVEDERKIDRLREDVLRLGAEFHRFSEETVVERDRFAADLSAADATIDELRNRVGNLQQERDRLLNELSRLIAQHAGERQQLVRQLEQDRDKTLALLTEQRVGVVQRLVEWWCRSRTTFPRK